MVASCLAALFSLVMLPEASEAVRQPHNSTNGCLWTDVRRGGWRLPFYLACQPY